MAEKPAAPTSDQLRTAIDRSVAEDKVAGSDPSAAPLGTDDEASGAPPSGGQVEESVRQEVRVRPPGRRDRRRGETALLVAAASVALFLVVGWMLWAA
jgi:hypothetical protein